MAKLLHDKGITGKFRTRWWGAPHWSMQFDIEKASTGYTRESPTRGLLVGARLEGAKRALVVARLRGKHD